MFKRVSKSIKRKEKEDKLGITELKQQLKEEAGDNAEASGSRSGSSSGSDSEDDDSSDEENSDDGDGESMSGEGESDSDDDDDDDDEGGQDQDMDAGTASEGEEEIPVSIEDCLEKPIYKLPTPDGVEQTEGEELAGWSCVLCPNKIFANEFMTETHVKSNGHVRSKARMTNALSDPATLPKTSDPRVIALSILDTIAAKQLAGKKVKIGAGKGPQKKMNAAEKKAAKEARAVKREAKKEAKRERKARFLEDRKKNGITAGPRSEKYRVKKEATENPPTEGIFTHMLKVATAANLPIIAQLDGNNRKTRKKMLVIALNEAGMPVSEMKIQSAWKGIENLEGKGKQAEGVAPAIEADGPEASGSGSRPMEDQSDIQTLSQAEQKKAKKEAKGKTPKEASEPGLSKTQQKKRQKQEAIALAQTAIPVDPTFDNGADFVSLGPQVDKKAINEARRTLQDTPSKKEKKAEKRARADNERAEVEGLVVAVPEATENAKEPPKKKRKNKGE